MILFESDWLKYPTATLHLETTNTSFVRFSALLRSMGIKNHTFMLALINPRLRHINPHSADLTIEQMIDVGVECKINPWYFFREVAKAPALGGTDPVMVEANRGNISLWWCFFNHITIFLIQIRQTGKSFSTDVLQVLLLEFICQNTTINLLTLNDILRRSNIERMKAIIADLPKYLQHKTPEDANNTEELTVLQHGNRYKTHVPQMSAKRAANMGRGLTSAIFQIDESPFQANIEVALPAALAATGAAIDRAKLEGTPYGTIFTTTAGKKDDKDGAFIYKMVMESAIWSETFYDALSQSDLELMVRKNAPSNKAMINATFNHRQLGKSDEWLRGKLEASHSKGEDANRDYFNMWTAGSQSSPLPLYILEAMARGCKDVAYTEVTKPYNYMTRWYIPRDQIEDRMKNGKFIMGMDTSEAVGRDEISLVLIDVETLEVVAGGSYNETNLITFSEWLCNFIIRFENVTTIIERKSTGGMILDYLSVNLLKMGIDPFKRLFNWVVNDVAMNRDRFREVALPMNRRPNDLHVRYKRLFGFATAGTGEQSRGELYSTTLQNAAKLGADRMNDKKLIDQTAGLITRNGRVDHPKGEHDDMTIGWLLGNWLLSQGTNLVHYGIDPARIMCRIAKGKTQSAEEIEIEEEQVFYRGRIANLLERIKNEPDEFVADKLEKELRVLDSRLVHEVGEMHSLDQLLQSAKESRWSKHRQVKAKPAYDQNRDIRRNTPTHQAFFSSTPFGRSATYF